jgi:hypothetical protein
MMKTDFLSAVEIERQSNLVTFEVPGVGECTALPPFAWREQDFLEAIRQYRNRSKGTHDTRALVALSAVTLRDEETGTDLDIQIVVGSMIYEIHQEAFEIVRLSAHPGDERTRSALIDKLIRTCQASKRRHRISCYVSDGDWETLRFFVRLGWERRLLPSYFPDGRDAWHVLHDVVAAPPPRRDLAAGP